MQVSELEFNDRFQLAYDFLVDSRDNVFITGKAGTGKSTLLKCFRDQTDKNVVVLAPTGVAAVNVGGQTIHSFCHFKPDITRDKVSTVRVPSYKKKIIRNLDAIVVDEISMVRADLLDCMDEFLRLNGPDSQLPFGGIQMIFFGDLYQLPPVVTQHDRELFNDHYESPYFFDAHCFDSLNLQVVELIKIYRQREEHFIRLLNSIRNNSAQREHLEMLNARVSLDVPASEDELTIYLATTNALAQNINDEHLKQLKGPLYRFEGELTGEFRENNLPTQEILELKNGAQVMMLNNAPQGQWINGSLGVIRHIDESSESVEVRLSDGITVEVTPFTWDMYRFFYNEETARVESEVVGSFTQYPMRLAWAVTIHKSQGMTFDKVVLDIGNGTFAHGQTYVALSRCKSLEGLVLKRPLYKHHILLDPRVVAFTKKYQDNALANQKEMS